MKNKSVYFLDIIYELELDAKMLAESYGEEISINYQNKINELKSFVDIK